MNQTSPYSLSVVRSSESHQKIIGIQLMGSSIGNKAAAVFCYSFPYAMMASAARIEFSRGKISFIHNADDIKLSIKKSPESEEVEEFISVPGSFNTDELPRKEVDAIELIVNNGQSDDAAASENISFLMIQTAAGLGFQLVLENDFDIPQGFVEKISYALVEPQSEETSDQISQAKAQESPS